MTVSSPRQTAVAVCDTQPIVIEGLKSVLDGLEDFTFSWASGSLEETEGLLRLNPAAILVLDKTFGTPSALEFLARLGTSHPGVVPVIWGHSMTEAEALRFLKGGCRGIIRKTAAVEALISCLRAVSQGITWMEDSLFREARKPELYPRSELTSRERQVLELVQRGLKNKDIARELSIRPGTVKIHLKHIFEKTGVRGRYSLALSGMKERAVQSVMAV